MDMHSKQCFWRMVSLTKYLYIKSTTVYVPSSELGLSHPPPLLTTECTHPPEQGGGPTRMRGRGGGVPIKTTGEKKLNTLPTLWCPLYYILYM
jgi:hypothetical protein